MAMPKNLGKFLFCLECLNPVALLCHEYIYINLLDDVATSNLICIQYIHITNIKTRYLFVEELTNRTNFNTIRYVRSSFVNNVICAKLETKFAWLLVVHNRGG